MANPRNSCSKHGSFFLFVTLVSWSGPFLPVQSDSSLWPCGCGRSWSTISPWHLSACWGLRLGPFNLNEPTSHNYWKDILVSRHSDNGWDFKADTNPIHGFAMCWFCWFHWRAVAQEAIVWQLHNYPTQQRCGSSCGPQTFGRAAMPIEFHRISRP